eukprot:1889184-Pyramimonas_sp.AAC.1
MTPPLRGAQAPRLEPLRGPAGNVRRPIELRSSNSARPPSNIELRAASSEPRAANTGGARNHGLAV